MASGAILVKFHDDLTDNDVVMTSTLNTAVT